MSAMIWNGLVAAACIVLAAVTGGVLGTFLQTRIWTNQWFAQRKSKLQEESKALFDEVSRLMDRRLFRLTQLLLWLSRNDEEKTEFALSEYRTILFEWNDSINRIISSLQFYFGTSLREYFASELGNRFVEAGAIIENIYRCRTNIDHLAIGEASVLLETIRSEIYNYDVALLHALDEMACKARPRSPFNRSGKILRNGR